jgi:hypothetical protein
MQLKAKIGKQEKRFDSFRGYLIRIKWSSIIGDHFYLIVIFIVKKKTHCLTVGLWLQLKILLTEIGKRICSRTTS